MFTADTFSAISAIGGLVSAFGSVKKGYDQSEIYNYNAKLSDYQVKVIKEQQALNEFNKTKQIESVVGSQRTLYAKSGVLALSGSPIDVMIDSLSNGYLDIAIDKYNSEIAANISRSESETYKRYAEVSKMSGIAEASNILLKTGVKYAKENIKPEKKKIGEGE